MAGVKASVNLFALLDGNDPGDKRLVDFDSQLKEQAGQTRKKPASPGYKPKKEQAKKKPPTAAASTMKKPTSAAKSDKISPTGYKAPRQNHITPAVAATAPSMAARSVNKQTIPAPPAPRTTDLTSVLFAFPSARERIFKQRQEEFERRQVKMRQEEFERQQQAKAVDNGAGVSVNDAGKGAAAAAGASQADKKKGKTHGVRVQLQGGAGGNYYVDREKKQQLVAAVKEPPLDKKPAVQAAVVKTVPTPPPPSMDDIVQFPSLKD